MNSSIEAALKTFDLKPDSFEIKTMGSGLIHQTFLIKGSKSYVLQKLNTSIFKNPEQIEKNIALTSGYLKEINPEYLFPASIPTYEGKPLFFDGITYWRLSPFVFNSITIDVADKPELAFEAAKAFGQLAKLLNDISVNDFEITISDFHNLSFRYEQFQSAISEGISSRISHAAELIQFYNSQKRIVDVFDEIKKDKLLPIRVQHHDTKINNVLLDSDSMNALAICDLDTLMPGYFISDLGDMVRTYTSAENEESTNWDAIKVRPDYYDSLMRGYLSEMQNSLTETEKEYLFYAGEFMIYMQGLRFLADYLLGDVYYPVKHELHNFNRSKNQMLLLGSLQLFNSPA